MPVYTYKSSDGDTIEEYFHGHSHPKRINRSGKVYERWIPGDFGARKHTDLWDGATSIAMGCTPQNLPNVQKFMNEHGVEYNIDNMGRAILKGKQHREKMRKAWSVAHGRELIDLG